MKLFGYELIFRKVQGVKPERPLFDVSTLSIHPGDTVIFTTPAHVTPDISHRLMDRWHSLYPDVKAIVLADGLKLDVQDRTTH